MKTVTGKLRRALQDYDMVQAGDRIAVGLSGGKDSLCLLHALKQVSLYYPARFELVAITLDLGFGNVDFESVARFCGDIDVRHELVVTDIKDVVFDIRRERNPCSLCAKMRRGSLHSAAQRHGCNKVALGHHADDAVETFLLSLLHEGRLNCFAPKSYLSRRDLTLIRPLVYTTERELAGMARTLSLPVLKNPCPVDGHTQRQRVKELISGLSADYPDIKNRVFGAICRGNINGFRDTNMEI